MMDKSTTRKQDLNAPNAFLNRELSWLAFAERVIAQIARDDLPLLERVKFVGIAGMLHDEFFMKRISGLRRRIERGSKKMSLDGRYAHEEFFACREELQKQSEVLGELLKNQILPALSDVGLGIRSYDELTEKQKNRITKYFEKSVKPILTPLAVDSEHPFPFISGRGLNLAVLLPKKKGEGTRFVRIKVPDNRPRWIEVGDGTFIPLEEVIAANLNTIYDTSALKGIYGFRVTRGAQGEPIRPLDVDGQVIDEPGSILHQVSSELKARRFAGAVRLECSKDMPKKFRKWLARQLDLTDDDIYVTNTFLASGDLNQLIPKDPDPQLIHTVHQPVVHPRLKIQDPDDPEALFREIERGDILLHHPYHDFDSSVGKFIESAALDPRVLAIKLTIYRTSKNSNIVRALAEAARRGKQVAVLVEVTARFDEAPNIAWGKFLEREGVHVSYGVERLKTHVKHAMVVREVDGKIKSYIHAGTGNYNSDTARIYEDLGILTAHDGLCEEIGAVFNALTGATALPSAGQIMIAPDRMRSEFKRRIKREAKNAVAGEPAGIFAKMNQLQDAQIIKALYRASNDGVPINLQVRGLCCLRPGVKGFSENIKVSGVVDRFLEHSRLYRFENGGDPEFWLGSADWMSRNLDDRVETVVPVLDDAVKRELDEIIACYKQDNCSIWDLCSDGNYVRRTVPKGEKRVAVQELLAARVV